MKNCNVRNDTSCERDTYGYKKDFRTAFPQILAVTVKNLILMTFGTTLGFPTILIPAVRKGSDDELQLSDLQLSWISSVGYICVPLGCVFSGVLTTILGRKKAMMLVNIPWILAWWIYSVSSSVTHLYVCLAMAGISGGLMEAAVLTYVAEITQPYLRGILSASSTMFTIIGVSSQFLLGIFFNWRTVALINISLPLTAIIGLFFIPESPYWLLLKNKHELSKKSLAWLRGWTSIECVENEYKDLLELVTKHTSASSSAGGYFQNVCSKLSQFKKRGCYIPCFLVSFVFFMGHFCGMTTLQTYAVLIFEVLHAPIDKYYATLLLGVVEIIGTVICVCLIHFTGKRPIVFFSTIGVAICFIVAGGYAYNIQLVTGKSITVLSPMNKNETISTDVDFDQDWIPITFLIGSALISHMGIRLLPWILIGEVFPPETRSTAAGFTSALGYVFGFLSNMLFLSLIKTLTLPGIFWFYSAISLFGTVILYKMLPETEGYTLNAITKHFSGEMKLPNRVNRNKGTSKNNSTGRELWVMNNQLKISDENIFTVSKL